MVGELDPKSARLFQTIEVVIEGRPPTLNSRRHWRAVAADNKAWKGIVTAEARQAVISFERRHGLRWRTLRLCTLDVVFVVKDRRSRDWDNLISTIKPEIDGLVEAGVMLDDSSEVVVRVSFTIRYEKGVTETRFIARELDES